MKEYISPTLEVTELRESDVIITSGGIDLPEIPIGGVRLTAEDL